MPASRLGPPLAAPIARLGAAVSRRLHAMHLRRRIKDTELDLSILQRELELGPLRVAMLLQYKAELELQLARVEARQ